MALQLKVIAHRGASALAPENSRAAAVRALELGVYAVEADVRRARDGTLVVCHDAGLLRLTGQDRLIEESDWPALAGMVIGHDAAHGPQTLQRLADLLALVRGRGRVLLDLKLAPGHEKDILQALRGAGMESAAIAGVRSLEALARLKARAPQLATLALGRTLDDTWALVEAGAGMARLWSPWVDEAQLGVARRLGRPVWVMCGAAGGCSVGETTSEQLRAYRRLGVDGVILNDPRLALEANAVEPA